MEGLKLGILKTRNLGVKAKPKILKKKRRLNRLHSNSNSSKTAYI